MVRVRTHERLTRNAGSAQLPALFVFPLVLHFSQFESCLARSLFRTWFFDVRGGLVELAS